MVESTDKKREDGWLPLGEGKGIRWTLCDNSVAFQRKEKQGSEWTVTEEIHLAVQVLKEIGWRIPLWLAKLSEKQGGLNGE